MIVPTSASEKLRFASAREFSRTFLQRGEKSAGERFAFVPLPMFSKSLPITFSQSILLSVMLFISLPPPSLKIPQRRCSVPTKECPRSEASPMAALIEEFALGVKPENLNISNLAFSYNLHILILSVKFRLFKKGKFA